tara:strand:+ start:54 stop:548 length:495 start_codon:yes stop_codon:yes gene_type:complete
MSQTQLLNDKWDLYYHLPTDQNWNLDSYKTIMKNISSVEEVSKINKMIIDNVLRNNMLFLMRNGIDPQWEHEKNRAGGCFSYKVHNKVVPDTWRKLFKLITGESFCDNNDVSKHINGITVSPKKSFCIIKVWMDNIEYQDSSIFYEITEQNNKGCIFKKHQPEH